MILVLAPDDPVLVESARRQSFNFPEIYGQTYIGGIDDLPMLAPGEDLFISGHGTSKKDGGIAEIGNADGVGSFGGIELYMNFVKDILPEMYEGGIYVDACYSANQAFDRFSLIEDLRSQVALLDSDPPVFGRIGEVGMDIPPPGEKGAWVEA